MRWFVFVVVVVHSVLSVSEAGESSLRCSSAGKFIKACKVSCVVLGHGTGVCTDADFCLCSGNDYDFFSRVGDWVEEELDFGEISTRMQAAYDDTKDYLDGWVTSMSASRCQLGNSFCRKACHAIGKLDGECNRDGTDCTCDDRRASLDQFTKCASASVCRVWCQTEGRRSGRCAGPTGWDCRCTDDSSQVETIGSLRAKRALFAF